MSGHDTSDKDQPKHTFTEATFCERLTAKMLKQVEVNQAPSACVMLRWLQN